MVRKRPRSESVSAPIAAPVAATPAATALALGLAGLAVARALFALPHDMAAWGLNLLRFVAPVPGWLLWAAAALAVVPAVARRAEPFVVAPFAWCERRGWGAVPWALLAAAIAWAFPDRLLFVGDFLLRENTGRETQSIFRTLYPQGLPLDALLHDHLVRALAPSFGDVHEAGRVLGAVEAGALGALAFQVARVLELRGAAAFATAAVVLWSGAFALFGGYGKAFAELVVVTVAMGVFSLSAVGRGSGLLPLGVLFAVALLLHRMALGLLPVWLVASALWLRRWGGGGAWRRPAALAAFAIPLVALAILGPRLVTLITSFDARHFVPAEVQRQGGPLAAAFDGRRIVDLLNLGIALVPLLPVALLATIAPPRAGRGAEIMVLLALAVPLAGVAPFLHPIQGLFRDWDVFAPTAAALTLVVAWTVAEILRDATATRGLALAVALGAFAPAMHWLLLQSDATRGMARVEAFVKEPPARDENARGSAWDFLGMRYLDFGRNDASAEAFAHAAEATPSPKILRAWAVSEVSRGNPAGAREIYRRLLARAPDEYRGWLEYTMLSMQARDTAEAERAAREMMRLRPDDPRARRLLDALAAARHPAR